MKFSVRESNKIIISSCATWDIAGIQQYKEEKKQRRRRRRRYNIHTCHIYRMQQTLPSQTGRTRIKYYTTLFIYRRCVSVNARFMCQCLCVIFFVQTNVIKTKRYFEIRDGYI